MQYTGEVKPNSDNIYSWESFLALGEEVTNEQLQQRIDAQKPTDACTLIYTSGTTGPPKAVMLSHDNVFWTATVLLDVIKPVTSDVFVRYVQILLFIYYVIYFLSFI